MAVTVWNPNHWTTREVAQVSLPFTLVTNDDCMTSNLISVSLSPPALGFFSEAVAFLFSFI